MIPGDRDKPIPEFKANLEQSQFQVEKSLGPDMVIQALNPSIQDTEPYRSLSSRSIYKASSRTAKLRR